MVLNHHVHVAQWRSPVNQKSHPVGSRDADRESAAPDTEGRTAIDDEFVVESDTGDDPFLAALDAAAHDDEPFTDDDRAAVQAGMAAYGRGESRSWTDVRQSLAVEDAAAKRAAS